MTKFDSRAAKNGSSENSKKTKRTRIEAHVLESILTPSGLVDVIDNTSSDFVDLPDAINLESSHNEPALLSEIAPLEFPEENLSPDVPANFDALVSQATLADAIDFEEVPFVQELESPVSAFQSGIFVVVESGEVSVDFLFDGGGYRGELAFFSLDGMDEFEPGSEAFIREAARRAVSSSELGHIVVSDATEGARFSGILGKSDRQDFNSGDYQGVKTFTMRPGDEFGVMLVPNGRVAELLDNPALGGNKRPLFSMATANPSDAFQAGQIVDVTGDGNTFVFEDLRLDQGSNRDYNDLVFQVRGAVGQTELMDDLVSESNDWRNTPQGQKLIEYVESQTIERLPDEPQYPGAEPPSIPQTDVDTGVNTIGEATALHASKSVDIIDQVSSIDSQDFFKVNSQDLNNTDFSVLDGQVSVTYISSSGEVLATQVLERGNHKLQAPIDSSEPISLKIESSNGQPATYMLYGFENTASESFKIDLEFDSSFTASQRRILEAAAKSIASFIDQGLPTAIVDGKLIDDLNIKISTTNLDSFGGTQARTKIDFMRFDSLLPAQSLVQFDAADIAALEESGQLFSVAQHEFLHALGFGNLWEAKGLVDYAGTPLAQYNGAAAIREFQKLGGVTEAIALETAENGSAGLHWHEMLFTNEIMTADLNGEGIGEAALSTVTLAALADLGYSVSLTKATSDFKLFGGQQLKAGSLAADELEAFRQLAKTSFSDPDEELIYATLPEVEPTKVAPEIWAHAERFWRNGQYYDWVPYQIRRGDTLSAIALRTMGSAHPDYYRWIANHNGIPDPNWIVAGDWIRIPQHRPNYEWEMEQERLRREAELRQRQEEEARIRREQEEAFHREQERIRQEEERRRLEAEAKQRELEEQERRLKEQMERRRQQEERRKEEERIRELQRQAEIARQQGKGGLDWFIAQSLPEFGFVDPFETRLSGETVGNLVPDDYYRFTMSRPGRIDARLLRLLADADLVLYDVRNRPIAYSMREGVTDEQILVDLIPGTYMLRVNSPKGIATDYDLVVKFKHLLSRTEQGPPPGWRPRNSGRNAVGNSGGGAIFSDPRIQQIYNTALNNFTVAERAKVNTQINSLKVKRQQYEHELQLLLNQMNSEQRAKIHAALDNTRHTANLWVDDRVNPIKATIDRIANDIISQIDGRIHPHLRNIDFIRNAIDVFKGSVNGARSWLQNQVTWAQNQIKHHIWQFIETVKNAYRTGSEINGVIENAARTMKNGIDSIARNVNGWIEGFKGKVLENVGWLRNVRTPDWMRGLGVPDWNFYDGVAAPLANTLAHNARSAVDSIAGFVNGVVDWVKPRIQNAVAVAVNAIFGDKTAHLWNKIRGVDAQITATQSEFERKIANKAMELKNQLHSLLNALGVDGKRIFDTFLNFANSPGGQVTIEVIKVLLGLIPGVGQAIDAVDTFAALWKIVVAGRRDSDAWVELLGSLAGWFPGIGDAIKGIAKIALKGPIGELLRKLGPDIVNQATKIFKEAKWKELLADVTEGLANVWRKFDAQMDQAAGWILDLMPGVRPALAGIGEMVVRFSDESAAMGEQLDDISKTIAKKIDNSSEQIAKDEQRSSDGGDDKEAPNSDDSRLALPAPYIGTRPSGSIGGKPEGTPEPLRGNKAQIRSAERENESAVLLANAGFKIFQSPNGSSPSRVPGVPDPDYLIEDKVFDAYSPESSNISNIAGAIKDKVEKGQTRRIVLNLDDSPASVVDVSQNLNTYPIDQLKEVIAIKNGEIFSLHLRGGGYEKLYP